MSMQFGNLANRDSDPVLELLDVEHNVVKRLIANFLVCSDPEESTLSLANLGSTYGVPVGVSVPILRGSNPNLLESLHRKRWSKFVQGAAHLPLNLILHLMQMPGVSMKRVLILPSQTALRILSACPLLLTKSTLC